MGFETLDHPSRVPVISTLYTFDIDNVDPELAFEFYRMHQILVLRKSHSVAVVPNKSERNWPGKKFIKKLATMGEKSISESWSVENNGNVDKAKLTPKYVFCDSTATAKLSYYISFIIQKDPKLEEFFLGSVPCSIPKVFTNKSWGELKHSSPIWVFYGQHLSLSSSSDGLQGRTGMRVKNMHNRNNTDASF